MAQAFALVRQTIRRPRARLKIFPAPDARPAVVDGHLPEADLLSHDGPRAEGRLLDLRVGAGDESDEREGGDEDAHLDSRLVSGPRFAGRGGSEERAEAPEMSRRGRSGAMTWPTRLTRKRQPGVREEEFCERPLERLFADSIGSVGDFAGAGRQGDPLSPSPPPPRTAGRPSRNDRRETPHNPLTGPRRRHARARRRGAGTAPAASPAAPEPDDA